MSEQGPHESQRDAIQYYQNDGSEDQVDIANQITRDLKGEFGEKAVAKRDAESGEILDWLAVHDEYNRVVVWWPEFYDYPVWNAESIYSFNNPLRTGRAFFTLHDWPEELDENAEVWL